MKTVLRGGVAALTALALVAVAACGGDDDGSADATTAPAAGSDTTAGGTPVEGGTVRVWIMGDSGPDFEELVAPFAERTGIDVEVESIPWENVNDKLTTAVASGDGPDLVQVGLSNLAAFQAADALADLTPYAADHPSLSTADYLDAVALDQINPAGKILSVPWISDTRVLFYRTDLLEEQGITEPPASWAELHDAATKLASRGGTDYGYYIPQWDQALPAVFTWQAGGAITDADGKVTFDSDAFRTAADFYLSFYADKLVPTASDFDQTIGFISGAAPMLVSGPYLAKAISDTAPELDGKWGVAPLPKGDTAGTSLFAGSNLAVWNGTEAMDQTLALLDFLAEPATQVQWYAASSQLPTVEAALADPAIAGDPTAAVYAAQLADAQPLPLVPKWDQIAQELLKALNGIGVNGDDEASTLTALNSTIAELQQ